jgi:hypothetical protein
MRSLVAAAPKVNDEAGVTINTPVNIKSPRMKLLIAILVPEHVRLSNFIYSSFDNARPTTYYEYNIESYNPWTLTEPELQFGQLI